MFNSKYSNILTVLLIVAIIAIVALIGYFGYDIYRKYYTNKGGGDAFNEFQQQVSNKTPNKNNSTDDGGDYIIDGVNGLQNNNVDNSIGGTTTVKPKHESGYTMVGNIEIPKINLKNVILEGVSDKKLDTAVCLQYGKLNEVGNAVIIGHNYRNGTFFSNLYKLSNGDKIIITDYTNKKVTYTIYSIFEAEDNDASFYQRETNGLREITLSTCTDDSQARTIILARES